MKPATHLLSTLFALFGLAAAPAALAQDCCATQAATQANCTMAHCPGLTGGEPHCPMASTTAAQASTARHVFAQPVQAIFDGYIKIQGALSQDSLDGVAGTAATMAKAIRADAKHLVSQKIADQTDVLAQAKNLKSARAAYKVLSSSLIAYLKTQKVPAGSYYEAYCPMAQASWLQTSKTISNPYMGKAMLRCGIIKS